MSKNKNKHNKKTIRRNKKGGFRHWNTPGQILIRTKKIKHHK
jgi:hypothetical protein